MQRPVSPWVGVIVVLVCIALVLLIYKFTVGAKVSREAPVDEGMRSLVGDPSSAEGPSDGPGGSHATPVSDDEVRTRPEDEKQPLPPDDGGGDER